MRDAGEAIPAKTMAVIQAIPNAVVRSATGLPLWAWSLIAVAGVGLIGFGLYKILFAAAPTVAGHFLARRS